VKAASSSTLERGPAPGVRDALEALERRFERLADSPRLDAEVLVMAVLGCTRAALYAHPERPLTAGQRSRLRQLAERRREGQPIAYLTGHREFWSLDLEVNPATLIPRPDTETLVEAALERIPADRAVRIADLGTGSGALALALARERPRAWILATDRSGSAATTALGNARRLKFANVGVCVTDWCAALAVREFDAIVSNPPYLNRAEIAALSGDACHEPRSALAGGARGLECLRAITRDARRCLRTRGVLLLEHGHQQGAAVRALLDRFGYRRVETRRDMAGHQRVSAGTWPG